MHHFLLATENGGPIQLQLHEFLGILTALATFLIGGIGILYRQTIDANKAQLASKDQEITRLEAERVMYRDALIEALRAAKDSASAAESSTRTAESALRNAGPRR